MGKSKKLAVQKIVRCDPKSLFRSQFHEKKFVVGYSELGWVISIIFPQHQMMVGHFPVWSQIFDPKIFKIFAGYGHWGMLSL